VQLHWRCRRFFCTNAQCTQRIFTERLPKLTAPYARKTSRLTVIVRSLLDKTLYACDELAGFCTAVALVRPEGIHGMTAKSVRKKMQQKSFAANVSRDDMVRGAEVLGVELNEHIQFVINAMASIADRLGLNGGMDKKDRST
jgi:predicted hydrolase (HD superfamily)